VKVKVTVLSRVDSTMGAVHMRQSVCLNVTRHDFDQPAIHDMTIP